MAEVRHPYRDLNDLQPLSPMLVQEIRSRGIKLVPWLNQSACTRRHSQGGWPEAPPFDADVDKIKRTMQRIQDEGENIGDVGYLDIESPLHYGYTLRARKMLIDAVQAVSEFAPHDRWAIYANLHMSWRHAGHRDEYWEHAIYEHSDAIITQWYLLDPSIRTLQRALDESLPQIDHIARIRAKRPVAISTHVCYRVPGPQGPIGGYVPHDILRQWIQPVIERIPDLIVMSWYGPDDRANVDGLRVLAEIVA